jgi:H+/Cl- antiporter ClcA
MFITGPAGAGKSTAITVAQSFCFEFCIAVGINWDDNTFLFTALTGCAASLFGEMTIHSAAHLQKKQNRFNDAITSPWKGVKILIVDEVSMATQELMNKLSHHMNLFKRATASKKRYKTQHGVWRILCDFFLGISDRSLQWGRK